MIQFSEVTKSYVSGDVVLDRVSFQIAPGELVIISGPSGSGKTTILRMIIKDLEPTSGQIVVDGEDITKLSKKLTPALRRKVGFVFQDYKIIPDRTVSENIALSLEIIGLKPEAITERVGHLLELVGMKTKGELFPRQLSGGELQRVSIARAIAPEPKILLADEPTGNLDADTAWGIIKLLQEINSMGTTVVITSHNQAIIDSLKVRHLQLKEGKLDGDTRTVGVEEKTHDEVGPETAEAGEEKEVRKPKKKKKFKVKEETI